MFAGLLTCALGLIIIDAADPANKAATQALCTDSKSGNQLIGECSFTLSGLHLLCGDYIWANTTASCADFGLIPANVNDANWLDAFTVVSTCNSINPQAWIASFNGYADDPCMFMSADAVNMADPVCELAYNWKPILCQEYVLTNHTITTTTTTTFSFGTTTAVVATFDPAHCRSPWLDHLHEPSVPNSSCSSDSSSPSCSSSGSLSDLSLYDSTMDDQDNSKFIVKSAKQVPLCPANLCPLEIGNWRVIDNSDCAAFGWNVADLTTGEMQLALELFNGCQIQSVGRLYIRSFNGISSTCSYLQYNPTTEQLMVSMSNYSLSCLQPGLYLCEVSKEPAVTGSGVASQASSTTTTWTTTQTDTLVVPTTTSTLTYYLPSAY